MKKIYSVLTITESQDYTPSVTIIAHFTSFDKAEDCLDRTFKDAVDDYTDTYGKDSIFIDDDRYVVESLHYHDSIRCEIQESSLDIMTLYFIVPIDFANVRDFINGNSFRDYSPEHLRDTLEDQFDCPNQLTFYTTSNGFCDALNYDEINLKDNFVASAEFEKIDDGLN